MKLQKQYPLIFIFFFLIGIFAVACGGGAADVSTEPEAASIEVIENDIYYGDTPDNAQNPPTWTVSTGQQVTVQVQNNGTLEHNWAIVEPGQEITDVFNPETDSDILLFDTGLTPPNSSQNSVFTAPAPGEYQVICTVAGHFPGMQGRLIVNE